MDALSVPPANQAAFVSSPTQLLALELSVAQMLESLHSADNSVTHCATSCCMLAEDVQFVRSWRSDLQPHTQIIPDPLRLLVPAMRSVLWHAG